jgi:hypothetical protein
MSDARPELSAATLVKQRRPAIPVTGARACITPGDVGFDAICLLFLSKL